MPGKVAPSKPGRFPKDPKRDEQHHALIGHGADEGAFKPPGQDEKHGERDPYDAVGYVDIYIPTEFLEAVDYA